MKIKNIYLVLFTAFFSSQWVYSDYSGRQDVGEFIEHMHEKHSYENHTSKCYSKMQSIKRR